MSELEQQVFKYVAAIKFNNTKKTYNFGTNDETIVNNDAVVVETVRGLEMGVVCGDLKDVKEHTLSTPLKGIIRKANEIDKKNNETNLKEGPLALKKCQECVEKLQLEMYLLSAEYTLDKTKVIFTYVADERVDFRELLKQLASIFKCRIELRQIGARDKAKIVGGLGTCGMETCCTRFLEEFEIVSINMAKNQLLALNTQKLSGQCGKLMCCLKYEDETYKELKKGLPKMNAQVEVDGVKYRITSMNILNGSAHLANKETAIDMTLDQLKTYFDTIEEGPEEEE